MNIKKIINKRHHFKPLQNFKTYAQTRLQIHIYSAFVVFE